MYLRNWLLLAALVWFATAAAPAMAAADSSLRVVALHDLAAQIYAAADDVSQAREEHRSMADVAANLRGLRGTFDAATHANSPGRANADAVFANKLSKLAPLLASIERSSKAYPSGALPNLIPPHLPANVRGRFGMVDERHGGACDHALGLGSGIELEGRLREQAEVWFRFEAQGPALYRVSTAATPLDTEIAVYARCPKTADEVPLSLNDDAFGLAAAAPIDLLSTPGPRWLRVRNVGPEGPVAVVVQTAGTISGHVTNLHGGNALQNAVVYFSNANGSYSGTAHSDATGTYSISLDAGTYHAIAGADNHLSQVWPQGFCPSIFDIDSCDLSHATLIVVAASASVPGIDFALDTGARISGHVRDHSTGLAVTDAYVSLFDNNGQSVDSMYVDDAGRYDFRSLFSGTYHALAVSGTHEAQLYANIECHSQNCNVLAGAPIAVAHDAIAQNIDFALTPYLYLNATVHLIGSTNNASAFIDVYNDSGAIVLSQPVNTSTNASAIGPLDPGNYRVAASSYGYFSQLYNHVDCATTCAADLASAAAVVLSREGLTPTLTFDLQPTPSVSGKITDSVTGLGLANTTVLIASTINGGIVANVATAADGTYTVNPLFPGSYYVIARSDDHHDEAYPDAPCLDLGYDSSSCALAQAQALSIAFGAGDVTNINMALDRNSSISGTVRYRASGPTPVLVGSANFVLYDAQGQIVTHAYSDETGSYLIEDLVAGTYYVSTTDYRYFGQVYAGVDCPIPNVACNPIAGTPIIVGSAQDVSGINFDPVASSIVFGRVTDSNTGLGIPGVALDLWNGVGDIYCSSAATDASGYYFLPDADFACTDSTRKVSTDASYTYVNQVFSGVDCAAGPAYLGLCSLANATLITVPTTQPQPIVANFVLHPNDVVFADGFD
ncbi:MAG: carboxypeptidase-like regulatory domain-containing protein [Dokdonella sp.]